MLRVEGPPSPHLFPNSYLSAGPLRYIICYRTPPFIQAFTNVTCIIISAVQNGMNDSIWVLARWYIVMGFLLKKNENRHYSYFRVYFYLSWLPDSTLYVAPCSLEGIWRHKTTGNQPLHRQTNLTFLQQIFMLNLATHNPPTNQRLISWEKYYVPN